MVASFQNSKLFYILSKKYDSTCILPQPLLLVSKNIFLYMYLPKLGINLILTLKSHSIIISNGQCWVSNPSFEAKTIITGFFNLTNL